MKKESCAVEPADDAKLMVSVFGMPDNSNANWRCNETDKQDLRALLKGPGRVIAISVKES